MFRLKGIRLLLLLALLQVLGGPAVLLGVAGLSKLMARQALHHGAAEAARCPVASAEWSAICAGMAEAMDPDSNDKAPRGKPQKKDAKPKLDLLALLPGAVLEALQTARALPEHRGFALLSEWPNGPPVPPPRFG